MSRPFLPALLALAVLAGCTAPQAGDLAPPDPGIPADASVSPPPAVESRRPIPTGQDGGAWSLSDFPGVFDEDLPTRRTEYVLSAGAGWENTVHVLQGAEDGPTIYLLAGVHGDETAGWLAAGLLKAASLRGGTLYILSPANPYGAAHDQRKTAEGRDINRNFPGDPDGCDAERIAADIYADIQDKQPDLVLDLHEAKDQEGARDQLGNSLICQSLEETGNLVLDLLAASEAGTICSAPLTLYGSPPRGSVNKTVTEELGVPVVTVETYRAEGLALRVRNHLEIAEFIFQAYGLR